MDVNAFMPDEAALASLRTDLDEYNRQRLEAARQSRSRLWLFLAAYTVVYLAVLYFIGTQTSRGIISGLGMVALVFGALAYLLVYGFAMSPASKLQQSFRDYLIPRIFGFIDEVKYQRGGVPTTHDYIPKAAIGSFNRQSFDDSIRGTYDGMGFEAFEAVYSYKAGKNTSQVFRGIVIAFQLPQNFRGIVVATKAVGNVSRFMRDLFGRGGLGPVTTGDAAIDQTYEFRSNNPRDAVSLINPRFIEALDDLRDLWPEAPSRVAISEGSGFVLLPTKKNFFELPKIWVACDYSSHIQPLVHDMVGLLRVAALVRGAVSPGAERQAG
ncbi:MAG: DUF3137 domain-containing protein [Rhizobiaceae bacterium]